MVKNGFYIKIDLRKRPFLSRLASYDQFNSDTTSVTSALKETEQI
jgi:hypothetical protein